jgi:c-di-AMP phosphodiesterase-like protein
MMSDSKKPLPVSLSVVLQLVIVLLIFLLLPILITWRWNWWQAWVYYALLVLAFILSRYLANRRHPDILQERASYLEHQDTQP